MLSDLTTAVIERGRVGEIKNCMLSDLTTAVIERGRVGEIKTVCYLT